MPDPALYCEVKIGGNTYRDWTSVSVTRSYENPISQFTLTTAEPSSNARLFSNIKIKPADKAELSLAGRLAISGVITVRQVAYDASTHAVQVVGLSTANQIVQTTPKADGKQSGYEYKGQSFKPLAERLLKDSGVQLKVEGNPPGLDKPFPRFSITPGESTFEVFERLCRLRNLYFHDDASGAIVIKRGTQSGGITLKEGVNILRCAAVLSDQFALGKLDVLAQAPSTDQRYGDAARVKVSLDASGVKNGREGVMMLEHPGDADDARMRGEREIADNAGLLIKVQITVHGWLADDGECWLNHVGKTATVDSPMIFPGDVMNLAIESATCLQSSETGTLSVIQLVDPLHLGSGTRLTIGDVGGA